MAQLTLTDFLKSLYAADEKTRLTIANDLKTAGFFRGTPSGKISDFLILQNAIIDAEKEIAQLKPVAGEIDRVTYYKTRRTQLATGGAQGGPSSSTQKITRVTNPTDATALINNVFTSLLDRPATAAEMKEIKPQLQKAEANSPVTTKYKTVNGVTTTDTTGGIDSQQFIINLINKIPKFKTELAKRKKTAPDVLRRQEEKNVYDTAVAGLDVNEIADFNKTSEYGRGIESTKAALSEYAVKLGAELDDAGITELAKQAYDQAIETDPTRLRELVQQKIGYTPGDETKGAAGNDLADLKKVAAANGLDLENTFGPSLSGWLQNIAKGESIETYKRLIRNTAKIGMPPTIAGLLDQGLDLESVYSPYKNLMASVLEVNPQSITLNDPVLRSAITGEKELPLYEFQRQLRKDSRWQYTDQAKQEVSSAAFQVLRDFGFQG